MLKNYTTEDDLKRYAPQKDKLMFQGQTNYNTEKQGAEQEVFTDLGLKGYKPAIMMVPLVLRESGTTITGEESNLHKPDTISRGRFVVNCTVCEGDAKTVILQGRNREAEQWVDVVELSITEEGTSSQLFTDYYLEYRVTADAAGGNFDYRALTVESNFELLFIFKWLEMIYRNVKAQEDDRFAANADKYEVKYNQLLSDIPVYQDTNNDGVITDEYKETVSSFPMKG